MFYFDNFYGNKILKSTLLSDFDCFFTTRQFVLTPANREDLIQQAEKNRLFLKNKLNCNEIYTSKQVHSDNIAVVEEDKTFYDNTDALISSIKGSLLIMNFADCVPIILYSKNDNTGAIVHAGWRGTAANIAEKTVKKMNDLGIKSENITALIGPAIGKCCFCVDEEVFNKLVPDISNVSFYEKKDNKYYIDLKLINNSQLLRSGITNIDICDYCICCMSDIFFSYRKENGITARHSAVIKIKEDNRNVSN